MKLFSFAYAGGDGHVFYSIQQALVQQGIEVLPYMYKGRNVRQEEGHYQSIVEAATEAVDFINKHVEGQDYGLLGHSMGGLIAYECYQQLYEKGDPLPKMMIFSGSLPPNQLVRGEYAIESDEELVAQLTAEDSISASALAIPEFKEYFLPIMKNDIRIFDQYEQTTDHQIIVPVTVLTGDNDSNVTKEKVLDWQKYTQDMPKFIELEGDHFFLFSDSVAYRELFQKICS